LIRPRATRLHAGYDLAELRVDRFRAKPGAGDRAHARGEVAVVADEARAGNEIGTDLALGRLVGSHRRDVNAVPDHRPRQEWLLRPRGRDDDIGIAHGGRHVTVDDDL